MKRRILHKIELREISAVDLPCQEHARAVIMKRRVEQSESRSQQLIEAADAALATYNQTHDAVTAALASFRTTPTQKGTSTMTKSVTDLEQDIETLMTKVDALREQLIETGDAEVEKALNGTDDLMEIAKALLDNGAASSRSEALSMARRMAPQAFDTFQKFEAPVPATKQAAVSVEAFMAKCSDVMQRNECSRSEAMQIARREHPALFSAFQEV